MGKLFAAVLILVTVLAIAGLCFRPATVTGVSDKSLAYSLRKAADSDETGSCRGSDDRFACTVIGDAPAGESTGGPEAIYTVETDNYGCWDAKLQKGSSDAADTLEGCITIMDLIRLDD